MSSEGDKLERWRTFQASLLPGDVVQAQFRIPEKYRGEKIRIIAGEQEVTPTTQQTISPPVEVERRKQEMEERIKYWEDVSAEEQCEWRYSQRLAKKYGVSEEPIAKAMEEWERTSNRTAIEDYLFNHIARDVAIMIAKEIMDFYRGNPLAGQRGAENPY